MPALHLVHAFDDAVSALEFLKANPAELLFVDINMPGLNDIELVKLLPDKPMTIFTTAGSPSDILNFRLVTVTLSTWKDGLRVEH